MSVSQGRGRRVEVTPELIAGVLAAFEQKGSVGSAARAVGCSHALARRLLVEAGLFPAAPQPLGKPVARAQFDALVLQGVWIAPGVVEGVISPGGWSHACTEEVSR